MTSKNLKWSDRALEENTKLLDYLLGEWGVDIALRITERINLSVIRIHKSPEQFPICIKSKNIRRCVMSPQTSIYFRVKQDEIEILSLFDNRQHPKKRKL